MSQSQNIEMIYSLSPMQEGMLFHTLYTPKNQNYFHQFMGTFQGHFNPTAFKQAWQHVVDHHAILRTLFVWDKGKKPLQVVRKKVSLPWFVKDWRTLSTDEQALALEQLLIQDKATGFSLKKAPLLRCHLIQTAQQRYQLVLSFHHLIIDGWSFSLILKDVFTVYQALNRGQAVYLPPIRPFRDYIYWLQEQEMSAAKKFWQARLQGMTAPTPLPIIDKMMPIDNEVIESQVRISVVPETIVKTLQHFVRQHRLTMNTLVQGAWALLLSHYSGETDVVFGVTSSGRPANFVGAEKMVGIFINTLPMKISLAPQQALLPWLQQIQATQVEQESYSYSALVDIQQWTQVPTPLFETLVVFENYPIDNSLFDVEGEFQINDFRVIDQINYPLALVIVPHNQLSLRMIYDANRFTADSIDRLLAYLQTLLAAYITEPAPSVLSQLPRLTPPEHQQLIEWNRTHNDYPQNQTLPQLIQAQVARTPTAIAVTFENQSLTYQQLNDYAHYFATTLQQYAIGPDQLVGVMLEPSLEMVVGLLGILMAGGAYLPFEPNSPQSRLQLMLAETQIPVLLTQTSLLGQLSVEKTTGVVTIDLIEYEKQRQISPTQVFSLENTHQQPLQPHHLAYVIYTSGSTGQPKGVMNSHSAVVNRLLWLQETYQLTSADCVLQKTPFNFDVSVWEFFWPLLVGARLVIAKPGGDKDNHYLIQLIEEQKITLLHFVPAMLHLFLQELADLHKDQAPALERLTQVFCSGEALSIELQQQFFSLLTAKLHNLYGPTEATIYATHWECQPHLQFPTVPIGRPMANTEVYLLDQDYQPVPMGVPGELYLGGVGLARGYLNQPALTAENFIPNPLINQPADQALKLSPRLYKTGDLARYLPESAGCLEYLGRLDFQIKRHGIRIELAEIETALRQHPAVESAVVIPENCAFSQEPTTEQQLIAYLVLANSGENVINEHASIEQWQQLYDEIYQQTHIKEPTFNLSGWHDSYTGQPIPAPAMQEWVENTVARILKFEPKRVLEIGCGTGLLLFRIAPHCEYYHGTEISGEALRYLNQHLPMLNLSTAIQLSQQSADEFTGIEATDFDTVILNSVVQCFPTIDYLFKVIEQAIQVTAPGGRIFIGDIRSLPLLEAFHASVQLDQVADDFPRQQLQQRIQQHLIQDKELVIDPRFFLALKQHFSAISSVKIELKPGIHDNELTHFRYDVTLICQASVSHDFDNANTHSTPILDNPTASITLSAIRHYLLNDPSPILIKNIVNDRLVKPLKLLELLAIEENSSVYKIRQALTDTPPGIQPAALWQLAEAFNYQLYLTPAITQPGHCHAIFYHPSQMPDLNELFEDEFNHLQPWRTYAQNPSSAGQTSHREIISQLRTVLKKNLPNYMWPAQFIFLETLPLTASGKIDRKAFPAPQAQRQVETPWIEPRTPFEIQLVNIWQEVLNLKKIGVRDNFFDLGGHSLQAIRVMAKIKQHFGFSLPLSVIFRGTTIEQLALQLEQTTLTQCSPLVSEEK